MQRLTTSVWTTRVLNGILVVGSIAVIWAVADVSSRPIVHEVTFDTSSEWGRYFLERSGFAVMKIDALRRSRQRIDYVSIVGKDRPLNWFTEMGFDEIHRTRANSAEISLTGLVRVGDGNRVDAVAMTHHKATGQLFYYLPDIGVLIFSRISEFGYDDRGNRSPP